MPEGVVLYFNNTKYRPPVQYRCGSRCVFAGWAPIGIGWMYPLRIRPELVLIVCWRCFIGFVKVPADAHPRGR